MKVIKQAAPMVTIRFEDLSQGDCFTLTKDGDLFMKVVTAQGDYLSVGIHSGALHKILALSNVIEASAVVHLRCPYGSV